MNIAKIIVGIVLLAIIPTHWFLASVTLTALLGFPGILFLALWAAFFIGGITLIIQGVMPEKPNNNRF